MSKPQPEPKDDSSVSCVLAAASSWCWVHQTFTYRKSFRVKANGDIDAIMQVLHGKPIKDPDRIRVPTLTGTTVERETHPDFWIPMIVIMAATGLILF